MIRRRQLMFVGLAACLFNSAGCGGGSGNAAMGGGTSRIRFLNAVPKSTKVDISIDGTTVASGLAYAQAASAGYSSVASGSHTVKISITNANPPSVSTDTISLAANSDNTLIAVGRSDNGSMHALIIPDDNSAPTANFAKLRVIHASPDASITLDAFITAANANIATASPDRNISYGTSTDYVEVAPGARQVRLSLSGTSNTAFDSGALTISAGQIRTLIAVDSADGLGFTTVLLNDKN